MEESIKNLTSEFFNKLSIHIDSCEVKAEWLNIFLVKVETKESGIVIGPHGKNLETIQFLLKLIISKQQQQNIVLHLEINDYLKIKEEKLFHFVQSKIEIVKKSGKDIELPFLTAYERKKVHSYVWELGENIFTKSEWEGKDRRMSLCKKPEWLTIDINGDDI